MKVEWIDRERDLVELCEHLASKPFVAVDTEFHREKRYFSKLALVQIASDERLACIDPLAALDLTPLDELMCDAPVVKVLHGSQQDLEIFLDRTGFLPNPIFDTQIAASLVGRGDQLSYGALVQQITGHRLRKQHGMTNWMARPLNPNVIDYAAKDVLHLAELYRQLRSDLEGMGRLRWLDEEQAHLLRSETYIVPDQEAWRRIKGTGKLRGVECAVAQNLAVWREKRARKLDRPRKHMLADRLIVDLARVRPRTHQALASLRSLDPGTIKRHGDELLAIIDQAVNSSESSWPVWPRQRHKPVDQALVIALSALVQHCAKKHAISSRMLASRDQLESLARGDEDVPLMKGWRAELVGNEIRSFLQGKTRLASRDGQLRVIRT